jgi:hypothetical protein
VLKSSLPPDDPGDVVAHRWRKFVLWWDGQEKAKGARERGTKRGTTPSQHRYGVAGRDGLPQRHVIDRRRKRSQQGRAGDGAGDAVPQGGAGTREKRRRNYGLF